MSSPWWPLLDLRVVTPRLELRPPDDDDLDALAELAGDGIHPAAEMPFSEPWTDGDPAEVRRRVLQWEWRSRAEWSAQSWRLNLSVWVDGRCVGSQGIEAQSFPALRTVTSGSWLGAAHQGQGIGKEMRAAALHLAFAGLDAERAESSAFEDNAASLGVTRALGYEPNGDAVEMRRDRAARQLRFVLPRHRWERRRRDDIAIDGLEPCLPLFGLRADL